MKQIQQDFLAAVDDVRSRLAQWRAGEKASRRIPEEFWREAVGLANEYGICRVSQALRLDYKSLRKRLPSALKIASSPPSAFLEWIAPGSAVIEKCSIELETSRGAKLRLELKGVPTLGLATLIREFAG